jgi:hypothetical protein
VGVVGPHSDQQLAQGFLPYQWRRGSCEVRSGSANLWYAAAKALGFKIGTIHCPDLLLIHQVVALYVGVKSLAPFLGHLRRASWTLCSRTSWASHFAQTLVNIGVRDGCRTFSTVTGLMIALIWMGHLVTGARA